MDTLTDKIAFAEQFDATPAGKALVRYRGALKTFAILDTITSSNPIRLESARRESLEAGAALIVEIKRLQDVPARIDKFIAAVAPSKISKEMDSIRQEVRRAL